MTTANHDIRNYTVGKGIVSFKETGQSTYRDLGNVTVFEFTPKVTILDHFSSRSGLKKKDRSVVLSTEGDLKITMDEFTMENLRLVLLGPISQESGHDVIDILQLSSITGAVKFTGTNVIGMRTEWTFLDVSFTPNASVSPLSDEWGTLEITGQVLANDAGKFGTVAKIGGEDDNDSSS